jgi:fructokinase
MKIVIFNHEKGWVLTVNIRNEDIMIVSIGEILFDQFPDYRRIGGAPFNVAAHLSSFGLESAFISRVGNDEDGKTLRSVVSSYGLNPDFIQIDPHHPTGKVNVILDDAGNARFDICEGVAYDFIEIKDEIKKRVSRADMIYFGTLIQRTENGFRTVHDLLSMRKPSAWTLCDINLRPGCYSEKIIRETLSLTDILKLNRDELQEVSRMLSGPERDKAITEWLMEKYQIRMISLTAGSEGSSLTTSDKVYFTKPDSSVTIKDTVGAGDAYASVVAAGILKDWDPQKILKTASRFAGKVCTIKGALPGDLDFYDDIKQEMTGD